MAHIVELLQSVHALLTDMVNMKSIAFHMCVSPDLTKNTTSLQFGEDLSIITYHSDLSLVHYEHFLSYFTL